MKNKLIFRMIVCAMLAIGLVLTGCDTGTNGGGTGTENTGNGDNTGNGGNNTGNGDNTGGNGGNGNDTGGGNTGGGGTTTSKPNVPYGSPRLTNQTTNSLTLDWNASLGATGYKLYRSWGTTPFVEVYSGSATTFKDTGVISGITYNYKVTATNSAGESGYSDVFTYMKL